jgi:hypothetical protein
MYISNKKYRLAQLDKSNLEPSARLLAESFLNENKIWGTMNPTPEEAYRFMYDKTLEMLDWEEELRQESIIPKDAFINFVSLALSRSISMNMTK